MPKGNTWGIFQWYYEPMSIKRVVLFVGVLFCLVSISAAYSFAAENNGDNQSVGASSNSTNTSTENADTTSMVYTSINLSVLCKKNQSAADCIGTAIRQGAMFRYPPSEYVL